MRKLKSATKNLLLFVMLSSVMLSVPTISANAVQPESSVIYSMEGIPNNTPVYGEGNNDDGNKPDRPNARDVFGDGYVGVDETGLSSQAGELIQVITNFIIRLANIVFIAFMLIYFTVESLMMAFPVVATFMATRAPVQLFSNECAKVCGVKYSYKPGGKAEGGVGGGSDAGVGGSGDGKDTFATKFTTYFKERSITLIVCGILLVMCATGVMPWLLNSIIDWILGLLFN